MRWFKSVAQAQKFLSAAEVIYQQTQPKRHQLAAEVTREIMKQKIEEWKSITGISVFKQGNMLGLSPQYCLFNFNSS